MKKILLYLILILIITFNLFTNRIGYLKTLGKPDSIKVDGEMLYVVDGATILTYSLENFSLLKTFGKKGNGPGELTATPFWSNQISLLVPREREE